MDFNISEFLTQPLTEITGIYGHYCKLFKIKNKLASDHKVNFLFYNALSRTTLSFIYDIDDKSFTNFYVKNENNVLDISLNEEDEQLIKSVLDIYLLRVQKDMNRVTREIRSDWGREFKKEIIDRSGFTSYFSNLSEIISQSYKLNIFNYTLSNLKFKNLYPFAKA